MLSLGFILSSQAAALVTGGARAPAGSSLTRRQALGAAVVLPFAPAACQAYDAPPPATKSGVGIKVLKKGTGGTSGVTYLRKMLEVELFPELWHLRGQL